MNTNCLNDDFAAELSQHMADATVADIRLRAGRFEVPRTGHCINCNEPVEDGLYCDEDCRSDHEYILNVRKHQGK